MILGALKNTLNKCHPTEGGKAFNAKELPSVLKDQGKDLLTATTLSQQAGIQIDTQNDIETAY